MVSNSLLGIFYELTDCISDRNDRFEEWIALFRHFCCALRPVFEPSFHAFCLDEVALSIFSPDWSDQPTKTHHVRACECGAKLQTDFLVTLQSTPDRGLLFRMSAPRLGHRKLCVF